MKILKVLTLIIALSFLTIACGGGGGGGGTSLTSSPDGIWIGIFHSNVTNQDDIVWGAVSEQNEIRFVNISNGFVFSGTVSGSGNQVDFNVTGYAPAGYTFNSGSTLESYRITGTITSQDKLSFNYTGDGDNGTIVLFYSQLLYERTSSLAKVNGTWESVPGNTLTMSNGNISGNIQGCTLSGTISIINPTYNLYRINVIIGNCGTFNGSYTGLGYLWDWQGADNLFDFMISNNTNAIFGEF